MRPGLADAGSAYRCVCDRLWVIAEAWGVFQDLLEVPPVDAVTASDMAMLVELFAKFGRGSTSSAWEGAHFTGNQMHDRPFHTPRLPPTA
jgi:hypothetical protein